MEFHRERFEGHAHDGSAMQAGNCDMWLPLLFRSDPHIDAGMEVSLAFMAYHPSLRLGQSDAASHTHLQGKIDIALGKIRTLGEVILGEAEEPVNTSSCDLLDESAWGRSRHRWNKLCLLMQINKLAGWF